MIRKKQTAIATGCLKIIIRIFIGILLICFAISFGHQKGFDSLGALKAIYKATLENFEDFFSTSTKNREDSESYNADGLQRNILCGDHLINYRPFQFKAIKQLELRDLDNLGRARFAHIQLSNYDKANTERQQK